jgi:6-phosphogluconate dehydrogenase
LKKLKLRGELWLWRLPTSGLPAPAFTTALSYYDSYRQARLPANLLQAQRDYFGAHTYQRADKPGSFHTEWLELRRQPKP